MENSVNLAAFDELIGSFGGFKVNNFGFRAFVANYNDGKLSSKSIVQARRIFFKREMFYNFWKKSNSHILFLLFSNTVHFHKISGNWEQTWLRTRAEQLRQLKVRSELKNSVIWRNFFYYRSCCIPNLLESMSVVHIPKWKCTLSVMCPCEVKLIVVIEYQIEYIWCLVSI